MKIRLAEKTDLDSIDRIYNQAIAMKMATADTVPYSRSERDSWFKIHTSDAFPVYVAEENSMVVAYMTLTAYRPRREALRHAVEVSYFVDEEYRRKGIGTELLDYGLKIAYKLGYKFIVAILMGHNSSSIDLLKKFGFEEWGRLPGIAEYDGLWFDHLIYGLKLPDQ